MLISSAYAQSAGGTGGGDGLMGLLPIVLMFVLLYFMMIRPQMKRQKEHKLMVEALKSGDEVIAAGGILGRITKVSDSYVTVEVGESSQIVVQRGAVQTLLPKGTIKGTGKDA
ncbi:MAG: preprotein translocase subunit YajC [Burkholderiales bacterium]|nr:preprotein translocase subunit YajC [Burkholderiales bacterium]